MDLSANARRVLQARYLRRDDRGQITETPEQLFARVARAVAHAELLLGNAAQAAEWEERFSRLLTSLDFLPNSPTLMNAGTPLGQLSACFVLPIEDSMESIFGALRDMALVQRTGGGTGFSFAHLRPAGDRIASTGGTSSGPISFMQIFDAATEHIKLGGRRRGANMGVLPVDHPDILAFIDIKRADGTLANFNLSVGVSDAFMDAAAHHEPYELHHPSDGRVVGQLDARKVFDRIVEAAWATGDPGLLFLDTINRGNPTPGLGCIAATNPCGEVPLLAYVSCNLGSINLAHVYREGSHTGQTAHTAHTATDLCEEAGIDWDRMGTVVWEAVRFLDDVLVVNRYPLPEVEAMTLATRKIGLGVMGFAELLIQLGIPYASQRAVALARRLSRFINDQALQASTVLAAERGDFPAWERSIYAAHGTYRTHRRNATLTSIAPTGTISIIAGTSSSIEPLFALCYRRVGVLQDETLAEINPLLMRAAERVAALTDDVLAHVRQHGTLTSAPGVPPTLAEVFATALEIAPRQHLLIQAAFQSDVENAVSKTVNVPSETPPGQIAAIYQEAHRLGLKGITVYRYGSRSEQVLQLGEGEEPYEREHTVKCDPYQCRL